MSDRKDRLARNESLFRSVNERIEDVVQSGRKEQIDFLCECGSDDCVENVSLTREEYEEVRADATQFIVKPGHEIAAIEDVARRAEGYLVVRKHVDEAVIAEETDPRG